ncbi:MAG: sulfite exporter TauE/SafE family protein [Planctomycetes bacterium]|nr:sulfite exporter TauE/SafE family protein [Planctomycetota bacterium]
MAPSVVEGVLLAVTGLVAGLCGGLLGIGGSIIMIPAMTELMGVRQHLYQAAALVVNFFVAVPALRQHVRAKAVAAPLLWKLIPVAMFASVLGVACSELAIFRGANTVYLTALFGLFLFYVAGYDIVRLVGGGVRSRGVSRRAGTTGESNGALPLVGDEGASAPPTRGDATSSTRRRAIVTMTAVLMVALPTGFVSGLLGVGGGIVAVPLQRRLLHLPLRTAIANSAAMIVGLSVVGATAKHIALAMHHPEYRLYEPVRLAIFLIPTAIIGASIGGRLTHVWPIKWVHVAFVILILFAGVRLASRALNEAAPVQETKVSMDASALAPTNVAACGHRAEVARERLLHASI